MGLLWESERKEKHFHLLAFFLLGIPFFSRGIEYFLPHIPSGYACRSVILKRCATEITQVCREILRKLKALICFVLQFSTLNIFHAFGLFLLLNVSTIMLVILLLFSNRISRYSPAAFSECAWIQNEILCLKYYIQVWIQ